jgi:hypothetical protein
MARSLVCSVALSGQAPKPHSGAPQARGLTANALNFCGLREFSWILLRTAMLAREGGGRCAS